MNKGEIIIYKTKKGDLKLEAKLREETIWLSLNQIAKLFNTDKSGISRHIKNIYGSEELAKNSTVAKIATVRKEGSRRVSRNVNHYNLDTIISIGYRVNSKRATQFRIWATNVLRNHIVKGYTINEKRLLEQKKKFVDFQKAVQTLTSIIQKKELTSEEATGVLQIISDYNYALDILDQYDHQTLKIAKTTKKDVYQLTYESAIGLVHDLREKFKSSDIFGREKDESFQSSVSTIYQTFDKKELYPSIEEKAAHLLYFIVKNHSFVDGNKRIAAFLFVWFLDKNGILYGENGLKRIADNALVALTLLIAESNPKEKDTITKVIVNLINRNN